MIRGDSSYKNDIKAFIKVTRDEKATLPMKETKTDIRVSFKNSLLYKTENEGYAKRLRDSEVATLLDYKKTLKTRRIIDFQPCCDILEKIEWFR